MAEASYAKNILINHDGFTPYAGLLGRHPREFASSLSDRQCNISDGDSGKTGVLADTVTIRERALEATLNTIIKNQKRSLRQNIFGTAT